MKGDIRKFLKLTSKMSKKGQAVNTNTIMTIGLSLGLAVMIFATFAIMLAAFNDSTTDGNATIIIGNGMTFLVNLTGQLGTIGTIAGVLLLLGLVVGSLFGGAILLNRARG